MHKVRAICAVAWIIATGAQAQKQSPLAIEARKIIEQRMTDPASLQIRNTRARIANIDGKSLSILCGEYNSKNRVGGYVGFKHFIYDPLSLRGVLTADNSGEIAFFSSSGSGDLIDPLAMVKAGADGAIVSATLLKYIDAMAKYLPACVTAS